ncbi:MAG TPA: hypothetical protein VNW50_14755 [Streptosporangiaceae bacterium]|nr:hypothetical protein [Streptosporangiaceae bacterium]
MNTKVDATEHGKEDSRQRDQCCWPNALPSAAWASAAIGRLTPGDLMSVPGVPPATRPRFTAWRDSLLVAF